jgi:hypothetical protein
VQRCVHLEIDKNMRNKDQDESTEYFSLWSQVEFKAFANHAHRKRDSHKNPASSEYHQELSFSSLPNRIELFIVFNYCYGYRLEFSE